MPEPVTTAMYISQAMKIVGPLLAALFGGDKKVNVEEEIAKLYDFYKAKMDPSINAAARAAQVTGTTVAQNMGTSMGRAGTGLRTGAGAAARAIGQSVGGTRAIEARGRGAAAIAQLVNQALPEVLGQQRQNANVPSRWEELIAGLGQAEAATGQDPIRAMLEMFGFDTPEEAAKKKMAKKQQGSAQAFMDSLGGGPSMSSPGSLNIQRPSMGGSPGGMAGGGIPSF